MLRLDLQALRQGPLGWEETIDDPSSAWPDLPVRFVGSALLRARAEPTGAGCVRITGGLRVRLALECRRCLERMDEEIRIELDLLFREGADRVEADSGVWPLERRAAEIDLGPALREEILLAVPEFPVCRPECRGLCPRCGASPGEGMCGCDRTEGDPRWGPLRSLQEG